MAQGGRVLLFAIVLSVFAAAVSSSCPGTANYTLKFVGLWKQDRHPMTALPGNAHFTSIVCASHDSSYVMWRAGENASAGVEQVAETGQTTKLVNEIMAKIGEKKVLQLINPTGSITAEGVKTDIHVQVTANYSLVSCITMIAPSPDWFVGIDSFDLCYNGKWRESFNDTESPPWDSGTDDGDGFTSPNQKSNPIVPIFQITNDMAGAFNNPGTPIKSMANWLFKGVDLPVVPQASPAPSTGMTATITMPPTTKSTTAMPTSAGKASVSLLLFATAALILALLF